MCRPCRASIGRAKARRWAESWFPATIMTGIPRSASPVSIRLSSSTASPEGELRS